MASVSEPMDIEEEVHEIEDEIKKPEEKKVPKLTPEGKKILQEATTVAHLYRSFGHEKLDVISEIVNKIGSAPPMMGRRQGSTGNPTGKLNTGSTVEVNPSRGRNEAQNVLGTGFRGSKKVPAVGSILGGRRGSNTGRGTGQSFQSARGHALQNHQVTGGTQAVTNVGEREEVSGNYVRPTGGGGGKKVQNVAAATDLSANSGESARVIPPTQGSPKFTKPKIRPKTTSVPYYTPEKKGETFIYKDGYGSGDSRVENVEVHNAVYDSETYIGKIRNSDMNKIKNTKIGDEIHYYQNGEEGRGVVAKMGNSYVTVFKESGDFIDIHINDTFYVKDIVLNKTWNEMSLEERTEALEKAHAPSPRFLSKTWEELPKELQNILRMGKEHEDEDKTVTPENHELQDKSSVEDGNYGNAGRNPNAGVNTNIDFDAEEDYEGQTHEKDSDAENEFQHDAIKPSTKTITKGVPSANVNTWGIKYVQKEDVTKDAKWYDSKSPKEQHQILLGAGVDIRHHGLSWQNLGQENHKKILDEYKPSLGKE